ncbi:MAG: DUF6441 family protein [Rhodobacteraceae bacterium]|nr:DUF6441 family protein [Paracoccaceae bacterium]
MGWGAEPSGSSSGAGIRNKTYPERGESLNAAAFIWSKAPKIIHTHDRGMLIRSKNGFYLAIPTEAAGKGRGGAGLTPLEWERRRGMRLRFICWRNGPSLLVAEKARINARGTVVVSQVKLRNRLDLARDAEKVARSVPGLIVEKGWRVDND